MKSSLSLSSSFIIVQLSPSKIELNVTVLPSSTPEGPLKLYVTVDEILKSTQLKLEDEFV